MRILHIIPSIAAVRGGPSQAVLEMVKALRNQGIDAEIVTTNDNGEELLDVPLVTKTEYQQVPVWFFPRFSPQIHSIREFAFSGQLTTWLWQNIKNYDLLHIHAIFSYPSTTAMLIARLQGITYICRPLGQLCQWSLQQGYQKKQAYLSLIEKGNLNDAYSLHFTTTEEQQEASMLKLKNPSFILPHGISIPQPIPEARIKLRDKLQIADNEPIILFLSRLHPKKGLDYLIPALGKLTHLSFTFVLAGNGDYTYEIAVENLLHKHNIYSRTRRVGFVQGEYKNLLLQGSDIFALTSYSENFGISVLEALAIGIPVVISSGIALSSVVKEYQLGYVTDLDVDAISLAIQRCLNTLSDRQKTELRRKNLSQLVLEKYSWDSIAAQLADIYVSTINNNSIYREKL